MIAPHTHSKSGRGADRPDPVHAGEPQAAIVLFRRFSVSLHMLTEPVRSLIAATRACASPIRAAMRGASWLPRTQLGQANDGSDAS